ncbi:MAG TPA: type II toxin-antitoxin system VapC family toxin [Rhizomicrobium sp.]|jgi:predicted nucleic acid-binding protein|nr:type II toxin-antitoxin system VapC family toxin [Rhizomicrobium sp.]
MIVIDASVALKWVLPEDDSDLADALRAEKLIAPPLWLIESANALWRNVLSGKITANDSTRLFAKLAAAPVAVSHADSDVAEALDLAIRLSHPIYDCIYLALARRENTHVVTADRRFHAVAAKFSELAGHVRLLGNPAA